MSFIDIILVQLFALGFDNPGNDAIFNMIAQALGQVFDNIMTEFTNTKNSILNTINTQRYGKSGYYTGVALDFQYGDDLIPAVGSLDPSYAAIDPSKQIVKQAAFTNTNGNLALKIAGQDSVSGQLIQLTAPQLSAFNSYFVNFEIPGLPVSIVCLPANIFSFNAVCTFNAGYDLATLQSNIQNALKTFLTSFSFNGVLYSDTLSTYIKSNVPGIIDFFVYNTQIDGNSFQGSTTLTAGYFNYIVNVFNNIQFNSINA